MIVLGNEPVRITTVKSDDLILALQDSFDWIRRNGGKPSKIEMNSVFFRRMVFKDLDMIALESDILQIRNDVIEFGTIYGIPVISNPNLQNNECYIYDEEAIKKIVIPIMKVLGTFQQRELNVLIRDEYFTIVRLEK